MNNEEIKKEEKLVEEVVAISEQFIEDVLLDEDGNVVDIESNEEFMTMGEGEYNE